MLDLDSAMLAHSLSCCCVLIRQCWFTVWVDVRSRFGNVGRLFDLMLCLDSEMSAYVSVDVRSMSCKCSSVLDHFALSSLAKVLVNRRDVAFWSCWGVAKMTHKDTFVFCSDKCTNTINQHMLLIRHLKKGIIFILLLIQRMELNKRDAYFRLTIK